MNPHDVMMNFTFDIFRIIVFEIFFRVLILITAVANLYSTPKVSILLYLYIDKTFNFGSLGNIKGIGFLGKRKEHHIYRKKYIYLYIFFKKLYRSSCKDKD